jgi:hypothetical protein
MYMSQRCLSVLTPRQIIDSPGVNESNLEVSLVNNLEDIGSASHAVRKGHPFFFQLLTFAKGCDASIGCWLGRKKYARSRNGWSYFSDRNGCDSSASRDYH